MRPSNPQERNRRAAIFSIHDVMPETLGQVRELVQVMRDNDVHRLTLLVVPGRDWSHRDIDQLRSWQQRGYTLAGHGWSHQATDRRSWRHRLHSWVISRNAAEHLSRSEDELSGLVERCYDWFRQHRLEVPTLYVPPAWALGRLSRRKLQRLPFRFYESLSGFYDSESARRFRLPLVGFEADTRWRCFALTCSNRCSQAGSRWLAKPLRVAIHPHDLELGLSTDLLRLCSRPWRPLTHLELVA